LDNLDIDERAVRRKPKEPTPMLDYLRILLEARLAKMDARGASAVEYGLLIAGIAALMAVVVYLFGHVVTGLFSDTCDSIGTKAKAGTCAS
jgi:pilus assembly protein Flp/PilA